ncbi:MAG: thioredoxin domain-containing protein [Acidobacteria bacterium]|nr:thioredoxin domain-containing protein [Acidobacteriota bacterium]
MSQKDKAEAGGGMPGTRARGAVVVALSLAGLGLAGYLTVLHMGLLIGEVGGSVLCGPGEGLGCHAVTASRYADFLGLPVSIWGVLFYATLTVLGLGGFLFRGGRGRPFLLWALLLLAAGLLFDLYLGSVMVARIRVFCPLCLATYAVNLALLIPLTGAARKRPAAAAPLRSAFPRLRLPPGGGDGEYYENVAKGLLLGVNVFVAAVLLSGYAVYSRSYVAAGEAQLERIQQVFGRTQPLRISSGGYPGLGEDGAGVTVVEFSDFRCPFCRRAADLVKIVAANNRDRARFVFRHFPLDTACNPGIQRSLHPGACDLAEGAVCAHEQGKFWEFHDQAFRLEGSVDRFAVERIAERIGVDAARFRACLTSGRGRDAVQRDIQEGTALGITSTPTFFFNGRALAGAPATPWVFEQLIRNPLEPAVGSTTESSR